MIESLHKLISALREELQHYGEMLARLEYHQDLVMRRQSESLLHSVAEVEAQGSVIQEARRVRECCQSELIGSLGLAEDAGFAELIPHLPKQYRPLVLALIQENNELLVRIQQRSRQNHLLLSRTLEMMQRFISTLFPGNTSPVYNQTGTAFGSSTPACSLYQAVG